jgi:hypothetical protein
MSNPVAEPTGLRMIARDDLEALVIELRGLVEAQGNVIEELVDERNAARLLIELCHY